MRCAGLPGTVMRPLPLMCATTVCVALAKISLALLVDRSAFALLKLLRLMSEEPLVLAFRFCIVPLPLNEPEPLVITLSFHKWGTIAVYCQVF